MQKIKVMVAEDHPIMRKAIVGELEAYPRIEVIGSAVNGKELIELVEKRQPDIVLLDLIMPEMNGLEVLQVFQKDFPEIRTIIYSGEYTVYDAAEAILSGVCAYLRKSSGAEDIYRAIEDVFTEGYHFNKIVSIDILRQIKKNKKLYYLIDNTKFSKRELEVLRLLYEEVPIELIADRLNISSHTVIHFKKRLFKKTESNTVISLIKYAIRHGIVKDKKA